MTATETDDSEKVWRQHLLVSKSGVPKPLLANAMIALRDSPDWQDIIAYDEFEMTTTLEKHPPWDRMSTLEWCPRPWTPQDDLLTTNWLQTQGIAVNTATTAQAVEAVGRDRAFHPVINYLNAIKHDGVPRLDSWLSDYLGTPNDEYHATVGRCMLIAAVARIFEPGCKVDTVPILEGPQGARKSTTVRTLFDPWFTDELADFGSKDAAMQMRGVWCVEISELDTMSRAEISNVKAFISRATDRFRPPYGHRIIEAPRTCVFWGTTNKDDYLKDETGARRFWPIKVGKIDIDGLAQHRHDLWAEAVQHYRAGVAWWIVNPKVSKVAEAEQSIRYVGDPWDEQVAELVEGKDEITLSAVLNVTAGSDHSRWGQPEANRVARILRAMGFERKQRRIGDKRIWIYRRLVPVAVTPDNVTTFRPVTPGGPVTEKAQREQQDHHQSPLSPPVF